MKTKLKWHDATKKRPKKSGNYITVTVSGRIAYLPYSKKHDAFNVYDRYDTCAGKIPVLLWAKVKAPKVVVS